MRKWLKIFKKNRGQSIVEYGLILIIAILATGAILSTKGKTEDALKTAVRGHNNMNPKAEEIISPDAPNAKDLWNHETQIGNKGFKLKPVAFFSIPNPIYVGEKITYWDNSYDPDGQIVERTWEGKVDQFNAEGEYTIRLTVKDNDDLTDTYEVKVKVEKREMYSRLLYDHENETRTVKSESPIYATKPTYKRILDHIYGKRKDLYGREHIVIEKNYWETVTERAKDITYEVRIPILEVFYDGQGNEISRTQYKIDGEPQYVIQEEVKTVPEPADIKTEWKDNVWTFYVYNSVSSVQNPNNSWGVRSPSVDYPRFDPEVERTRQDPDWQSSRTTFKESKYNAGYDAPSTPCPTCTIPNRFTRKSETQNQYNTVYGAGRSYYKLTHTRTHNWIEHQAFDVIYKYTGTGLSQGNAPSGTYIELLRHSWKTEGWQAAEQRGGSAVVRSKYTDCVGDGWSESCWQPKWNYEYPVDSWELYDTDTWTESKVFLENPHQVSYQECSGTGQNRTCTTKYKTVYDEVTRTRTCTKYYYKRKEWSLAWYGTELKTETYTWGYTDSTSCTSYS